MKKLRIKSGFDILEIDGHYTVVSTETNTKDNIYLDEISFFLWNSLKDNDLTQTQMLNLLLEKFDISTVLALSEIDKFVRILKRNEII